MNWWYALAWSLVIGLPLIVLVEYLRGKAKIRKGRRGRNWASGDTHPGGVWYGDSGSGSGSGHSGGHHGGSSCGGGGHGGSSCGGGGSSCGGGGGGCGGGS